MPGNDESVSKRHNEDGVDSGDLPQTDANRHETIRFSDDTDTIPDVDATNVTEGVSKGHTLSKTSGAAGKRARQEKAAASALRADRLALVVAAIAPHPHGAPPPNVIREALRSSHYARYPFLNDVIDGQVVERTRIELGDVRQFLQCPSCGIAGLALLPGVEPSQEIMATRSASVRDRLAAIDQLAKYGIGALKEVNVEQVREKVGDTIALIRELAPEAVALAIVERMRKVWTG